MRHDTALQVQNDAIFFAPHQRIQVHSASYGIRDDLGANYHLTSADPQQRQSGASILIIWEVIQFFHYQLGHKTPDFEGIRIKHVEAIPRRFKAIQTPYFSVTKKHSKTFNFLEENS